MFKPPPLLLDLAKDVCPTTYTPTYVPGRPKRGGETRQRAHGQLDLEELIPPFPSIKRPSLMRPFKLLLGLLISPLVFPFHSRQPTLALLTLRHDYSFILGSPHQPPQLTEIIVHRPVTWWR